MKEILNTRWNIMNYYIQCYMLGEHRLRVSQKRYMPSNLCSFTIKEHNDNAGVILVFFRFLWLLHQNKV